MERQLPLARAEHARNRHGERAPGASAGVHDVGRALAALRAVVRRFAPTASVLRRRTKRVTTVLTQGECRRPSAAREETTICHLPAEATFRRCCEPFR